MESSKGVLPREGRGMAPTHSEPFGAQSGGVSQEAGVGAECEPCFLAGGHEQAPAQQPQLAAR